MADIIPLHRSGKSNNTEKAYLHGRCICIGCGHEWVATAKMGAQIPFECPRCWCMKGVYKEFISFDSIPTWSCGVCAGTLFTVLLLQDTPTIACASCGELRNALDLWNKT